MTSPFEQLTIPAQTGASAIVNAIFETLKAGGVYGKDAYTSSGLVWNYYGGTWGGFAVTGASFTLTASATNYITVKLADGTTQCSTVITNWNDATHYARVYSIVTGATSITTETDYRAGPGGVLGGGGGGSTYTPGEGVNAQTGTTYTFLNTDLDKLVTFSNASAIAAGLPQAGSGGSFAATWFADVENRGAGTLTITPTTSTIDGLSSFALTTGQGLRLISDGTNYFTERGVGGAATFTGGTLTSALNEAPTVTIASSAAPAIGAAAGNSILLTGTTTVTGFDTIAAGAFRRVRFGGVLTLTYNATSLILPTSANIVTAANDVAEFLSLGSGNWYCTSYTRASGSALVGGTGGTGGVVKTNVMVAASDEVTALTASTTVPKVTFRAPFAMTGIALNASLTTAQATGATLVTLDVKVNGTTMFSTQPTFDNTEKTTVTAATPAVQTVTAWAADDEITVYCAAITSASVAAGLKLDFIGSVVGANVIQGVPTTGLAGDGSTSITTSSGTFVDMTGFTTLTIAASVGDIIEAEWIGASSTSTGGYSSFRFTANGNAFGAFAIDEIASGKSSTKVLRARRVVTSGDLVSGVVPIHVQWTTTGGTATCLNSTGLDLPLLTLKNYGDGSGIRPSSLTRGVLALTDAATILVNATNNDQFRVTLGGNRTLANPAGVVDGQTMLYRISQDGTGSRTLAYGSMWKFAGGTAPVLSTAANAKDLLTGQYDATDGTIFGTLNKAFA